MEREAIGSETIFAALDQLLDQPQLKKSPQLSAFLSYVVRESLAGRGSLLKSYTIATDALKRAPSFDPATDAIVRVEARRLRQVLQQIYADPGCPVAVRIELPLGRYEPNFVRLSRPSAPCSSRAAPSLADVAASLRESEQRYRALVEASAAVEWRATPEGGIAQSFGWTARTGQSEEEMRDHGWLAALHPDDRARTAQVWAESCRTAEPIEVCYRVLHQDGGYRWMLSRGVPLENPDGTVREWVGTVSDIHERVMAEEAQRTSEERLRLAVEAADLVTWEIDPSTRFCTCSPNATALFGGCEGPLEGLISLIHPEDKPVVFAALERGLRGEALYDVVYRITSPDGRRRWISARGRLMRGTGTGERMIGVAADVTSRYVGHLPAWS
ncbi:PAS domain-containing protein [Methylobacterium oryzisoli]|uniref:PAS domain-containing protein n=1 Tax=Methylobacterium oryzisoli TaxID=3385502 RepID=UPI003891DE26